MVTAHHIEFDLAMLEIEKAFLGGYKSPEMPSTFCTMLNSAPIVGIRYDDGYKHPSLAEAVQGVLGNEVDESVLHQAGIDSKYCKDIFLGLNRLGLVP